MFLFWSIYRFCWISIIYICSCFHLYKYNFIFIFCNYIYFALLASKIPFYYLVIFFF